MAENREKRHTEKCAWFLVHAMNEHILFMHSAGVTVTPSEEETLKKKTSNSQHKAGKNFPVHGLPHTANPFLDMNNFTLHDVSQRQLKMKDETTTTRKKNA